MKILVAISKTPDTTSKISFTQDGKTFNKEGISFIMNPYDEWYALVRAVELVEAHGGACTVIHVGPAENDIIIRKALAIGANDAVRIDSEPKSAMHVATQVAAYAGDKAFDYLFFGKETIDYNGAQVGAMVAELLDLPYLSFANKMEVNGDTATISREIEGGVETVNVSGPCVISAAKDMAQQRIPNMKGIMMSKSKPLVVLPPVAVEELEELTGHTLPPPKPGVKLIDPSNMDELVRLLHEEAKAI